MKTIPRHFPKKGGHSPKFHFVFITCRKLEWKAMEELDWFLGRKTRDLSACGTFKNKTNKLLWSVAEAEGRNGVGRGLKGEFLLQTENFKMATRVRGKSSLKQEEGKVVSRRSRRGKVLQSFWKGRCFYKVRFFEVLKSFACKRQKLFLKN